MTNMNNKKSYLFFQCHIRRQSHQHPFLLLSEKPSSFCPLLYLPILVSDGSLYLNQKNIILLQVYVPDRFSNVTIRPVQTYGLLVCKSLFLLLVHQHIIPSALFFLIVWGKVHPYFHFYGQQLNIYVYCVYFIVNPNSFCRAVSTVCSFVYQKKSTLLLAGLSWGVSLKTGSFPCKKASSSKSLFSNGLLWSIWGIFWYNESSSEKESSNTKWAMEFKVRIAELHLTLAIRICDLLWWAGHVWSPMITQLEPQMHCYRPPTKWLRASLSQLHCIFIIQRISRVFEYICACARWAHMHRFLSACLSWLDQNSD